MIDKNFPKELSGICDTIEDLIAPAILKLLDEKGYSVEISLMKKEEDVENKSKVSKYRVARHHKQYLYKMTFPNGKVYIGTTFDINRRWDNNGAGYRGQKVWEPIQKYGWDNIKKEVLMYIPYTDDDNCWANSNKIREEELRLIAENEGNCYNRQGTVEFHDEVARSMRKPERKKYSKYLTFDGKEKTYYQWSLEPGVTVSGATIRSRIEERGWDVKDALFTPNLNHIEGTPEERREIWKSYNNKGAQS